MGVVFGLSTICIVVPFLRTASDRANYSLQRGELCVGTVKSIRYNGVRYSGVCFHIFYCNYARLPYGQFVYSYIKYTISHDNTTDLHFSKRK